VRIAVIADTHLPRGARRLPDECVSRLRAADLILHAGDHSSLASLVELRTLGPPVEAVHGNIDEPAVRESLPAELVVRAAGIRIGMTHDAGPAAGREARLAARFHECAAVVYGHTHLPQVVRHDPSGTGGVWILNPGSPTERRRAETRAMLELTITAGKVAPELIRLSGP
jgi:putative phosphoesterase